MGVIELHNNENIFEKFEDLCMHEATTTTKLSTSETCYRKITTQENTTIIFFSHFPCTIFINHFHAQLY